MIKKIILLFTIKSLLSLTIYSQENIDIESKYFSIDTFQRIILINKNVDSLNISYPESKDSITVDNLNYTFLEEVLELEVGTSYGIVDEEDKIYNLHFTQLPVINITSDEMIVDEPKVSANFILCESTGNYIANTIGIEYKGGWTQTLSKKSYKVEFWDDVNGIKKTDLCLLEMRCDDDWNLNAMCNEPFRIRSKSGFELWSKIDTLYYHNEEIKAINGVRQKYVELFVNSEYSGLYALSERVDRKQLQLKKYKNGITKGELYKGVTWGATTFTDLPQFDNQNSEWSGFEYIYPDEEIDWTNIYEFIDFVISEDSVSFIEEYNNKFNIENAVNYFIFLNLLRATDNTGKNIFIAKYDEGEPYFYIPWDLDGSFGTIWNGSFENITDDILTNGFYSRLILDKNENGFVSKLSKRWNDLRSNVLMTDSLIQSLNEQVSYLQINGVYERELKTWLECESFNQNDFQYTTNWLTERLNYLDLVFNNPELLTSLEEERNAEKTPLKFFPNPANSYLNIETIGINNNLESISIVNNLGVTVCNKVNRFNNFKIDISNLSSGVYYLVANYNNRVRTIEKLIINE